MSELCDEISMEVSVDNEFETRVTVCVVCCSREELAVAVSCSVDIKYTVEWEETSEYTVVDNSFVDSTKKEVELGVLSSDKEERSTMLVENSSSVVYLVVVSVRVVERVFVL